MEPHRLIRLKGWCGFYTGLVVQVPAIRNDLEVKHNKDNKLDRLVRVFSSEETMDNAVDININDRLGTCIVK